MSRSFQIMLAFTILSLSIASVLAQQHCSPGELAQVKQKIRSAIQSSPESSVWPARLLRLGFHDCLPQKCDGSIQFELDRQENVRLDIPVDFLKETITGTCASLADAIKIGMELSMEFSRGPRITCPLGTPDATSANPTGQIALATDDFETLLGSFTRKRFTVAEAVAANYGGHSIGGFNVPGSSGPKLSFTPNPDRFGKNFCKFIVRPAGKTGFNALPSDRELASKPRTKKILTQLAGDGRLLRTQFRRFMTKLCSM